MTDLFGDVLSMIASAFEFLRHEEDVEAVKFAFVSAGFEMSEHDDVAKAVHLSVGAEDVDGDVEIARAKGGFDIGDHLFKTRSHGGEIGAVEDVDLSGDGFRAISDVEKEVSDALERDDELHAGEEFAGFVLGNASNGRGDKIVDVTVKRIEFLLTSA